jgi:hypothetical protein
MQHRYRTILVALLAVCLSFVHPTASADTAAPPPVRLTGFSKTFDPKKGPGALEVPIVHYVKQGSYLKNLFFGPTLQVDFIGVTHVGSHEYYSEINQRLRQYDAVLFELVAEKEDAERFAKKGPSSSTSSFQRRMGDYLGLSFQLDEIDYSAPNFVHADISGEQLKESLWNQRGPIIVSILQMLLTDSDSAENAKNRERVEAIQKEIEGMNLIKILLSGPSATDQRRLRRLMGVALTSSDSLFEKIEGIDTVLIKDRNTAALRVLKDEIGRGKKRIAILYGTGHLPDMHAQLVRDFSLSIQSIEWLKAWTL